ncbi:uncharacterized protein LOC144951640 [Lampetra fluviatilis]
MAAAAATAVTAAAAAATAAVVLCGAGGESLAEPRCRWLQGRPSMAQARARISPVVDHDKRLVSARVGLLSPPPPRRAGWRCHPFVRARARRTASRPLGARRGSERAVPAEPPAPHRPGSRSWRRRAPARRGGGVRAEPRRARRSPPRAPAARIPSRLPAPSRGVGWPPAPSPSCRRGLPLRGR